VRDAHAGRPGRRGCPDSVQRRQSLSTASGAGFASGADLAYATATPRLVRYIAIAFIIALGAAWGFAWLTKSPEESLAARIGNIFAGPAPAVGGLSLPQGISLGGPFSLTDQAGKPVTERDFAG
jgi:hypothetical protein